MLLFLSFPWSVTDLLSCDLDGKAVYEQAFLELLGRILEGVPPGDSIVGDKNAHMGKDGDLKMGIDWEEYPE